MMIAARLAGGNLFLPFLGGGFFGGGFWEHSEHSEQLGALGFFLRGFFLRGFVVGGFFFLWVVGCVLDCKCWKKIKND